MTGTVTPSLQSVSHYDLVEKIAEGGMGTVYRGRDQLTGKTVAVKVVPKHLLSNAVFLKRFEQERANGGAKAAVATGGGSP